MNLKHSNIQLFGYSILLLLFFALPLKAQVTIGAQKAPHSYSVLELMSAKGLRLPVLNNSERDALKLTPDSTEAGGLVIYNTDIDCIEFWSDGKWIDLGSNSSFLSPISGNNGVTKGATGLTYSVTPVSGVTTYTWTVPTGWSITAGLGTASITVTAGTTEGHAGTITVSANNGNCTGTSTLAVSVGCPVKTTSGNWLTFMCYNLGADDAVKSLTPEEQAAYPTPADEYGDLYQWGRSKDGHQLRTSESYPTNNTTDESGVVSGSDLDGNGQVASTSAAYGKFIKNNDVTTYYDWRTPLSNTLWYDNGKKTVNDPCPTGWRVPTTVEFQSIVNGSVDAVDFSGSYNSVSGNRWQWVSSNPGFLVTPSGSASPTLFLPLTGWRSYGNSTLQYQGSNGYYWSSSVTNADTAYSMNFYSSRLYPASTYLRALGFSIRCVVE